MRNNINKALFLQFISLIISVQIFVGGFGDSGLDLEPQRVVGIIFMIIITVSSTIYLIIKIKNGNTIQNIFFGISILLLIAMGIIIIANSIPSDLGLNNQKSIPLDNKILPQYPQTKGL